MFFRLRENEITGGSCHKYHFDTCGNLVFYAQSTGMGRSGRGDHCPGTIFQELCESRGGRPGLSVLTSLLVSVDGKNYSTVLRHWSQLVPNMSADI